MIIVDGPAGAIVTIRPMTISDYMNNGGSGCALSGEENPAEGKLTLPTIPFCKIKFVFLQ